MARMASLAHPLLLLLVASLAALALVTPSEAVTAAQVRAALVQARARFKTDHGVAATALIRLLNTKAGKKFFRFNKSPTLTILLPSDWSMTGYKFRSMKPAQTVNIFNHAMLLGKFTIKQLQAKPYGTEFKTAYLGRNIRKVPDDTRTLVSLRVGTRVQGPRATCEALTGINNGDLYIGPNIAVHGTACLLTPADFKGGPFGRRGLGPS